MTSLKDNVARSSDLHRWIKPVGLKWFILGKSATSVNMLTLPDPLRSYIHEPQENEIYLLYLNFFYIVLVHYLCNFDLNLANKSSNPTCLVITFNSRHYDMTSIESYVGQTTIAFIYDVAYT